MANKASSDGIPGPSEAPVRPRPSARVGGFLPGPWKHSGEGAPPNARDPRVWIYAPVGPNHPSIATVECVFGVNEEAVAINLANARLIAAAPDMYEALREAAATFRQYEVMHREKRTVEGEQKAVANGVRATRCEAALAKAEA